MRLHTDLTAHNTHRQYTINNIKLARSAEKLASGYRINRAADDAAGLAISEKMRKQIRGLRVATRNCEDGISLIKTVEGALEETHSILQRMNELAVQAATGTNQRIDRQALSQEFEQLKGEINDIAEGTTFNDIQLLDGSKSAEGYVRSAQTSGITWKTTTLRSDADIATAGTVAPTNAAQRSLDATESPVTGQNISRNAAPKRVMRASAQAAIRAPLEMTQLGLGADASAAGTKAEAGTDLSLTHFMMEGESMVGHKYRMQISTSTVKSQTTSRLELYGCAMSWTVTGDGVTTVGQLFYDAILADPDGGADQASPPLDGFKNWEARITDPTNGDIVLINNNAPGKTNYYAGLKEVQLLVTNVTGGGVLAQNVPGYTLTDSRGPHGATWIKNGTDTATPGEKEYTVYKLDPTKVQTGDSFVIRDKIFEFVANAGDRPTIQGATAVTVQNFASIGGPLHNQVINDVKVQMAMDLTTRTYTITVTAENVGSRRPITEIQYYLAGQTPIVPGTPAGPTDPVQPVVPSDPADTAEPILSSEYHEHIMMFDPVKMKDGDTYTVHAGGKTISYAYDSANYEAGTNDSLASRIANDVAAQLVAAGAQNVFVRGCTVVSLEGGTHECMWAQLTPKGDVTKQEGSHAWLYATDGLRIQVGALENEQMYIRIRAMNTAALGLDDAFLTTQNTSGTAITVVRDAINIVSDQRATLGAQHNRLDHKILNLKATIENLSAAESRIRDVDMAAEMATFTKNQILNQAATAMLAQANARPQNVLSLLQ